MNENIKNEDIIFDVEDFFLFIKKHLLKILISSLVCGIAIGLVTKFLIEDRYSSNARIFLKPEVSEGMVDYSNISSNNSMVNNYVEMIRGNNIQTKVANKLGIKVEIIHDALNITNVNNTQLISITASTTDPELCKKIVDATVDVFIEEVKTSLGVSNISIVDEAVKAKYPVYPNLQKNVLVGLAAGFIVMFLFYFIKFILDTKIHNSDECEKYLGIPNLGSIPYFED